MKTTSDHVIVYDADCPMCNWYTGQFVKHGFLSEGGREAYQKAGPFTKTKIDMNKARNHIALLNKSTGEVKYGPESLVEILASRWEWVKKVATLKIIAPFVAFLYDFVSFNRKVIMPTAPRGFLDCIPDNNLPMRIVFLVTCMLGVEITAGTYFTDYFSAHMRFNDIPFRESILFISQLVFQGLVVLVIKRRDAYNYLGNLAFVSFLGGLVLLFFHVVFQVAAFSAQSAQFLQAAGLGAVVMWMFMEHNRRIRIGNFPKILSYSWVVFRIILFFVVFKF